MSGLFSSKTKSSSSTKANKATEALFYPAYNQMQAAVNKPFTPYTGQLSAGMNPDQLAARGLLDVNAGQGATNAAIQGVQGLLGAQAPVVNAANAGRATSVTAQGYQPLTGQAIQAGPAAMATGQGYTATQAQGAQAGAAAMANAASINRGDVRNLNADTIASGMGLYQNPYEQQVVSNTLSDLDLQRQRSINNQAGGFTQAGAFGGSRQGVADSLTNEAYLRESANASAALRSQGFNTAAGLAGQDVGNRLMAGQANQNADLSVLGQNAGFAQQANLTNAAAANSRDQFNAGLLQQTGLANMDATNQAAQFGAGAQNTANLANQNALNSRDQFNASLGQDMSLANLSAGNRAAEFGAGAQNAAAGQNAAAINSRQEFDAGFAQQAALANAGNYLQNNSQNLQAAGLLGNLGQQQQGMNLNAADAMNAFGTQAQQLDQGGLDRMYQQYLLEQQYGQNQIANMQGLLGTIPALYAGAATKGTTKSTPSIAGILGAGLQTASMFGLGGGGGGAAAAHMIPSDIRLKADITPAGQRGGHNWYQYRYVWDEPGTVREGVMAQEVMHTGAVSVHPSGYLMVNYEAL